MIIRLSKCNLVNCAGATQWAAAHTALEPQLRAGAKRTLGQRLPPEVIVNLDPHSVGY